MSTTMIRVDEALVRPPQWPTKTRAGAGTASLLLAAAVLVVLAVGAWRRRWMADDGLIVLRTVRNLLAGNGPVFNAGDRVESNTSTLWTYLVTAFGWVPAPLEWTTVVLSLVLTLLGLAAGMLAARTLHGGANLLLPLGALAYVALPPARDFATSGLETGLMLAWLGGLALLLATRAVRPDGGGAPHPARVALSTAFVAGLGPMVRPELAMVGGLALLLVLAAPLGWARRAVLVAVAGAVPLVYQVFRMGYYGLPYPLTAVAKEASDSQWGRGWGYVTDLAGTYWLWLVLAVLLVLGLASLRRVPRPTSAAGDGAVPWALRRGAVVGVLLGSGLLYVVYVVRVGGDFMHGRMLLPGLFLLLVPVMELPLPQLRSRVASLVVGVAGAAVVLGWSVVTLVSAGPGYGTGISAAGIADERAFYVSHTGVAHPVLATDYLTYPPLAGMFPALRRLDGRGGMVWAGPVPTGYWEVVPTADPAARETVFFINMGMTSMNVGLDVRVVDNVGLTNPVAAHADPLPGGRVGHSKIIPPDWEAARQGLLPNPSLNPVLVADARQALACTRTHEMIDSSNAPLTVGRFVQNLRGAFSRAGYRYPYEPDQAAARCEFNIN